jgi:hypothetical protein
VCLLMWKPPNYFLCKPITTQDTRFAELYNSINLQLSGEPLYPILRGYCFAECSAQYVRNPGVRWCCRLQSESKLLEF